MRSTIDVVVVVGQPEKRELVMNEIDTWLRDRGYGPQVRRNPASGGGLDAYSRCREDEGIQYCSTKDSRVTNIVFARVTEVDTGAFKIWTGWQGASFSFGSLICRPCAYGADADASWQTLLRRELDRCLSIVEQIEDEKRQADIDDRASARAR